MNEKHWVSRGYRLFVKPIPWGLRAASLVGLFAALALVACAETPHESAGKAARPGAPVVIRILHTNDFHARLAPDEKGRGGAAHIAAYFKRVRAEHSATLVLDAGDMTQGSPVSTFFQGRPIFEVYNAMGYDAATLGNHEFDNGLEPIGDFKRIAKFPIVSANVRTLAIKAERHWIADKPYVVLKADGVKVGILGLTTSEYIHQPVIFSDPADAMRSYLPELRERCDIVIALTHLGHNEDLALAREVSGFDAIIGGHSHTAVRKPVKVGTTIVAQAGSYGHTIGDLTLTYEPKTKKVIAAEGRLVPVTAALGVDEKTKRVVDKWEKKVSKVVDVAIGRNPQYMDRKTFRRNVAAVWLDKFDTDFAYHNLGGTRAPLPAGPITIRQIYNSLPFENTVTIVEMTRAQVAEEIDGARFAEDKPLYTVATNSYVGDRWIEKYRLPDERVKRLETASRDPVIEYVREHGDFDPSAPERVGTARREY